MTLDECSAADVEQAIADAIRARDFDAVVGLMHVLAFKAPRHAQAVLDVLQETHGAVV
jgi:ketosteroid isomerase-like protein